MILSCDKPFRSATLGWKTHVLLLLQAEHGHSWISFFLNHVDQFIINVDSWIIEMTTGACRDLERHQGLSVFYICLARFVLLGQSFSTTLGMAWYPLLLSVFRGLDVFCLEFFGSDLRSVTWQRRFCYSRSWYRGSMLWKGFLLFFRYGVQ
jgi:hypothetical protein